MEWVGRLLEEQRGRREEQERQEAQARHAQRVAQNQPIYDDDSDLESPPSLDSGLPSFTVDIGLYRGTNCVRRDMQQFCGRCSVSHRTSLSLINFNPSSASCVMGLLSQAYSPKHRVLQPTDISASARIQRESMHDVESHDMSC